MSANANAAPVVTDDGQISIDVNAVPGSVAIGLPNGTVVLVSHTDWRAVAAALPAPPHRQPRLIPGVITRD
jgi:hypothetical protein